MPPTSYIKREYDDDDKPKSPIVFNHSGKLEASLSTTKARHIHSPASAWPIVKPEIKTGSKEGDPTVYHCWFPHCTSTFGSLSLVTSHYRAAHMTSTQPTCTLPSCTTQPTFWNAAEFDRHLADKHPNVRVHCNICALRGVTKSFGKFSLWKAHKASQHGARMESWKCAHCGTDWKSRKEWAKCVKECVRKGL